jgi:hypothetical protein
MIFADSRFLQEQAFVTHAFLNLLVFKVFLTRKNKSADQKN